MTYETWVMTRYYLTWEIMFLTLNELPIIINIGSEASATDFY